MPLEVLDPTFGEDAAPFQSATRLPTVEGMTIGIVSNGKKGTAAFFDALEHELRTSYGVAEVVRTVKLNYSAPAETELMAGAEQWHALISGIGD